jgi:uncharacterized membrane protein
MDVPPDPTARAPIRSPTTPSDDPVLFDALLMPHRSLPPLGFGILMAAISLVSFGAGLTFYLIGAWPIVGFLGLDVLLVYVAFRVSFRRLRAFETLRLTEQVLVFERVSPAGVRRRWTFQPYWLRIEFDDPPDHGSQLRLRSHGRAVTVGAFLAMPERQNLADSLRAALHKLKNPLYDHEHRHEHRQAPEPG